MSTPAFIAREVAPSRYVGRYHHHDGEPAWLGRALWQLYHGYFAGKLEPMQEALLDAHPAGWLTVIGEWSFPARYFADKRPQCLCHGSYRQLARTLTERSAARSGCEFGYVFARDSTTQPLMRILAFASRWETTPDMRVVRRTHLPDPEVVASVLLEGAEPNWDQLCDHADAARTRLDGQVER